MARPIVVGIDVRDLRIAKGGAKTYLEELCREFKKPDPEFVFYFFDTKIKVYTGKNKPLKLLEHIRFLFWKQFTLPVLARIKKCDIIFCSDYFVPLIQAGYKTVPVFLDAFFWEYPGHYNKYWLSLFRSIGVAAAKKSPFMVTLTQHTRDRISFFSGIPKEKIIPVYIADKSVRHAADDPTVSPAIQELLSKPYILHVGTFEKRKNLPFLITAFKKLIQTGHTDIRLILIGQSSPKKDMDDSELIRKTIEKNELSAQVILPGYLTNKELQLLYKKATLYVFPSVNEGFGIPVLEAFSYRIPVLIANNSCLPEVAGDAAISFDPYNTTELYEKMKILLENPGMRNELVQKADKRLAFFSWEKSAAELKNIFRLAHHDTPKTVGDSGDRDAVLNTE